MDPAIAARLFACEALIALWFGMVCGFAIGYGRGLTSRRSNRVA